MISRLDRSKEKDITYVYIEINRERSGRFTLRRDILVPLYV